ncbi:arylsulfatase [Campylobacter jejuni]|nr:arylsulfatase [Campylobacter jejuni]
MDFILLIVKVSYIKTANGKSQKIIDEIYKITTPGVSIEPSGRH